jgi:hypothetical protein
MVPCMLEFTLKIDLGKKERDRPDPDRCPTDRRFIAAALKAAAEEVLAAEDTEGVVVDDTDFPVGGWKIGLGPSWSEG